MSRLYIIYTQLGNEMNKFDPSLLIYLMLVSIHVLQIPKLDWSLMKNRNKLNNIVLKKIIGVFWRCYKWYLSCMLQRLGLMGTYVNVEKNIYIN